MILSGNVPAAPFSTLCAIVRVPCALWAGMERERCPLENGCALALGEKEAAHSSTQIACFTVMRVGAAGLICRPFVFRREIEGRSVRDLE